MTKKEAKIQAIEFKNYWYKRSGLSLLKKDYTRKTDEEVFDEFIKEQLNDKRTSTSRS